MIISPDSSDPFVRSVYRAVRRHQIEYYADPDYIDVASELTTLSGKKITKLFGIPIVVNPLVAEGADLFVLRSEESELR